MNATTKAGCGLIVGLVMGGLLCSEMRSRAGEGDPEPAKLVVREIEFHDAKGNVRMRLGLVPQSGTPFLEMEGSPGTRGVTTNGASGRLTLSGTTSPIVIAP